MEMANHWLGDKPVTENVRTAVAQDKADIMLLLQNGRYTHVHLDWQPPADWVGESGFVVAPAPSVKTSGLSNMLFGPPARLAGCLAAVADPAPAAWVRVAAIRQTNGAEALLATMLAQAIGHLRETAVTQLAWLLIDNWPQSWLAALGFQQINAIATYLKRDLTTPPTPIPAALTIRPAQLADMEALAEIEAAAFAPLWRHSVHGLRLAYPQACCFDVAEWHGRVVGFQYSTQSGDNAHLSRMTVLPSLQGHGIGSALLAHAINTYKKNGLRYVTLNTQLDNQPSQKLYLKFGFQPNGQQLPVWAKPIDP